MLLLSEVVSVPLMPKGKEVDLGEIFTSYYTPEENAAKPLPPSTIEATREKRRKDYAAIARECVKTSSTYMSFD